MRTGSTVAAAGLALAALFAPVGAPAETLAEAVGKTASPPMWRVSDEDSEIFLLGTFHILPPGLEWRSDSIVTALDAAKTIWFEAEVDTAAAKQKTLQVLMTQGFNADGKTLSELLAADDAARLKTIAAELGLPMKAIDPMRPWQAFLTLSVQFIVEEGFDPSSGVETVLLREARAKSYTLNFFETVEEQLGLFANLPPKAEKDLLTTTLREWDQYEDEFDELFTAWATGDIAGIDAMMNKNLRDAAPAVYDILVTRRNAAWAEALAAEMRGSGTALVAVGAGHLVGAGSVPALLEAKGFRVERYSAPAANDNAPAESGEDAIGGLLEGLGAEGEDAQ